MAIPTGVVYARAGLLGNPSDGYGGKALACTLRNFAARVVVEPGDAFVIAVPDVRIRLSPDDLMDPAVSLPDHGLARLVGAAWRRFLAHVVPGTDPGPPMTLACTTTIPREVGLAGSSAVILATFRALAEQAGATLSPFDLAEQALATEVEDLGIAAGAMDRVIQAYGGVMVMDLAAPRSEASYRHLDRSLLPELLIAWDPQCGTSSGVAHGDLRRRWLARDPEVLAAVDALRDIVERGVRALEAGEPHALAPLFAENFAWRCRVFSVGQRDREMVTIVERAGGAAKLCGSGGAIVAVAARDGALSEVQRALVASGYEVAPAMVG